MITGRIVFSSRFPCEAAKPTTASLPSTCAHTISMASHCVGFTLPGMIDEPGSFSGRISSPSPARGPEPSQRMSLAIFASGTASPRSPADAAASASEPAKRRELVRRGHERVPGRVRDPRRDLGPEPGRRVEPGADRGTAHRELVQARAGARKPVKRGESAGQRTRTTPVPPSAAPRPAGGSARSSPRRATAAPLNAMASRSAVTAGITAAAPPKRPRRASRSGTCRWTTAPC